MSSNRKIGKARSYIMNGNRKFKYEYLFILVILMLITSAFFFGIDKTKEYDSGFYLVMSQGSIFLIFSMICSLSIIPTVASKKQQSAIKGSATFSDVFSQLPVTKKQCLNYSFFQWAKISLLPIVGWSIICLQSILLPHLKQYKGEIGFVVFFVILFLASVFFSLLLVSNCSKRMKTVLLTTTLVLMFFFMFLGLFLYRFNFIFNIINKFDFLSGPFGIACLFLIIPVMYIIMRIFVLNKKGKDAWFND